ncbi:MAG: sigma 54-interacting transcriptional regulator [Acidobacteria bacterium]|nr:sigma 54-interacting transcriptional regulator [Acidobacteriota bacterium]
MESSSDFSHEVAAALFLPGDAILCRLVILGLFDEAMRVAIEDLLRTQGRQAQICRLAVADRIRNCLVIPVRAAGCTSAIAFVAPDGVAYTTDDLGKAEDLVQRISMASDQTSRAIAASKEPLDVSEEVLRELAHVLHVGDVFPRISAIVKRVLPHDRMTMTFQDTDSVTLQLASLPVQHDFRFLRVDPGILARPYVLFPNMTLEEMSWYEPAEAREFMCNSGFLSFLAINVRARDKRMGVEFWAKNAHAFSVADVPMARTIANYLALAVSHEQLASSPVDPSPARAAGYEARVTHLLETLTDQTRRIVGTSPVWTPVLGAAKRVAETDATVLLIGESGTGKEVIARFIHSASRVGRGPFVAVNCAALPEQLLESELFGFERGAFTGATHSKPGQIELAAGGILFLDEVSEMSPSAQAKFLRFLQEREFRRLGGTRLIKSDVRVIAATNVDLQRAIHNGTFRRDLYYRLRVFDIRLPSLRERREDIAPLSDTLLDEISQRLGRLRPRLTSAARAALQTYRWPGNVRELRNVLERAVILSEGGTIGADDLSFDEEGFEIESNTTDLNSVERDLIDKVLRECGGNKSLAAKKLGLSRMQLYVRLRRYDLPRQAMG